MNKKIGLIIAIVAALLLAGAAFMLLKSNDNGDETSNSSGSGLFSGSTDPTKNFNPKDVKGLSYVSTTTAKMADGSEVKGTTEADNKGNLKMVSDSTLGKTTNYTVDGVHYLCENDDPCQKLPDTNEEISEEARAITERAEKEFEDAKKAAKYVGMTDCAAGKCATWEITVSGVSRTYKLDGENRISETTTNDPEYPSTTVFEYKDVIITAPNV